MASFRSLPPELVLEIGVWLDDQFSLSALARANRTCRSILMPSLFTRFGSLAVRWAAEKGNLDILRAATFYAKDRKHALLNTAYQFEEPTDDPEFDRLLWHDRGRKQGTALHLACAAGHIEVLEYLIDNGADMCASSTRMCGCLYMDDSFGQYYGDDDIIDRPKWLPLHHAICHKHPEVAIALLKRGAPIYVSASSASRGRYSVTALQSASENGLVMVVRYLKERFQSKSLTGARLSEAIALPEVSEDVSMAETDGATDGSSDLEEGDPFDSEMSDFEGLDDEDSDEDENEDDDDDEESSDPETDSDDTDGSARTDELDFWGQSADPSDPRSADLYGNTAMHYVSLCFDFGAACTIVRDLVDLGLDIDERGGRRDASPLLMACCMGNFSAARAFLRAGAFPEPILEEDFTEFEGLEGDSTCIDNALYARYSERAAKHQSEEKWKAERYQFLKELIKAGVDVEDLPGDNDVTPLGIAAQRGLEKELKLLLEFGGAYVNGMADRGKTALMAAAQRRQLGTVKILLEAGASVNQTTGFGVSAVDFACSLAGSYGHEDAPVDILKLLLEHGARVGIPVEDPQVTTMCRPEPCIHDSFLLKMVRRATMSDDDEADEDYSFGPRRGSDYAAGSWRIFNVLMDHATEANITRDCWQAAAMEAFSPLKSDVASRVVCKKLGEFGRRLGYVFDDSTLANIIGKLIAADEPEEIDCLFLLGNGRTVETLTGVFTRTALLILVLARGICEENSVGGGWGSRLVAPLLESIKNVKGTIRLQKNKGTLLHLAASAVIAQDVKTLLDKGCELDAVNLHGMTPLSEAVKSGQVTIARLLLRRGADPYFTNAGREEPVLPNQTEDISKPPEGRRWSRAFLEMLGKYDCLPVFYVDEPSPFELVCL